MKTNRVLLRSCFVLAGTVWVSAAADEITGTHGFEVRSPATYVEIEGFLFTHQSGRNRLIRPLERCTWPAM